MTGSELAKRLLDLVAEHGDMEVFLDINVYGLRQIGEVDVDAEDTGIIIWLPDKELRIAKAAEGQEPCASA
jgi:hypothetical protein